MCIRDRCDPEADPAEARAHFDIKLSNITDLEELDLLIIAVAHSRFKELPLEELNLFFKNKKKKILFDLKGVYEKKDCETQNYTYWRL